MGMTLQSLKTYGYIDSKTKSYWSQRRFLLLFIFLPDLGFQAACLPILSLRLHAFRSFPLGSLTKDIHPSLGSLIHSNNLNPLFAESLVDFGARRPAWQYWKSTSLLLLHCCNRGDQIPESRTRCVQQAVLLPPAWRFQRPKALCKATDLVGVDLYNDQVIDLQL